MDRLGIGPAFALHPEEAARALPASVTGPWRPALEAAAGCAPYLGRLAQRRGASAALAAAAGPEPVFEGAMEAARAAAGAPYEEAMAVLRAAKADVHLACALGDLSGDWDLARVTGALSGFAEEACRAALGAALAELYRQHGLPGPPGVLVGFIVLAMGKLGAGELNYSSDIDLTLFLDPDALPEAFVAGPGGGDPKRAGLRLAPLFVRALEAVTPEGYVFRTDLRLRPDPASMPVVVTRAAAETYYQSVGQNWERAAFIKACPVAGDLEAGADFLRGLEPFIWRRHLDYAAIADIQAIKRQILAVHKGGDLEERAPDVKLGRGGIRDIELFVQTQQLILGGRDASLRAPDTIGALEALTRAGHLPRAARDDLARAYAFLRGVEHRIQMLQDQQTHRVPADPDMRARVAALCGLSLAAFDAALAAARARVVAIDRGLFRTAPSLADPAGSLVFTGVEDDPGTLETLARLGFERPEAAGAIVRGWHHGRLRAMRSERAREILTALTPALLRAMAESGEPDTALMRFDEFLAGLPAGVQVLSLLQARPGLLRTIADAFGLGPRLARALARRPALMDAVLDTRFAAPLRNDAPGARAALLEERAAGLGFEAAMNAARRFHREEALRVGLQVLQGRASAQEAGLAHADLAEACVGVLTRAALAEMERRHGGAPGPFAVLALGSFGAAELNEGSDLDMVFVYDAPDGPRAEGSLPPGDYFARLAQRLISALSAPTEEGLLYAVDMRLRPSGAKGPVAVRLSTFARYYHEEAWIWEMQTLTRLRPVAGDRAFGAKVMAAAREALTAAKVAEAAKREAAAMRARLDRDRPSAGLWDLKRNPGGLVDIEFIVQALTLSAPGRARIEANTGAALSALRESGLLASEEEAALRAAWVLQSDLIQVLRACQEEPFAAPSASTRLKMLLARTGGAEDFAALEHTLARTQTGVRALMDALIGAG